MRHIIIALVIGTLGLITFLSVRTTPPITESPSSEPVVIINREDVGICIWDKTGLRESYGKNGKYITSLSFGEQIELLGDTMDVPSENRSYIKIRLLDGKEGWVNQYLIAEKASLAVFTKESPIYRRPDMMTRNDKQFEPGDIVATVEHKTINENQEWFKVIGDERRKSGWIKSSNALSVDENNILVAKRLQQALKVEDEYAQRKALVSILADEELNTSDLHSIVEKELNYVGLKSRLPDDKLYITESNVSMRSIPKKDEGEILNLLAEGTVCEVVSRGNRESIGNMNDYWYEIDFQGKRGWVYGQFTSKGEGN